MQSKTREFVRGREAHGRQAGAERETGRAQKMPRPAPTPVAGGDPGQRILDRVAERSGAAGFGGHLAQQTRAKLEGRRLVVSVPTGYVAQLIESRFGSQLVEAAAEELARQGSEGAGVELVVRVDTAEFGGETMAPRAVARAAPVQRGVPAPGGPALRYRLEDFIVGEANRLAFTAAERMADPDSPRTFSPLFVHGACGLGKTHLLQGVAQRFRERRPRANVRYLTAESFTNEYVTALRHGRLESFRKAYRSVELLCLDDVQFLTNKTATQAELLHTFDEIDLSGAKVALASDEHPRHVRKFSEALTSRFMSGMVVRLDPPDPALREKIVAHLASRRGMVLEPAAINLLAARGVGQQGSVRDLEGVLMRLDALSRLLPGTSGAGGAIGLVLVRKALGLGGDGEGAWTNGARRPIRIDTIIDEICRTLHIQLNDFVGRGRHKRVVLARAMTVQVARELTTLSYPEIARAMGRPNHSTIVTAHQRIRRQIEAGARPQDGDWSGAGGGVEALKGMTIGELCEQVRRDIQRLP